MKKTNLYVGLLSILFSVVFSSAASAAGWSSVSKVQRIYQRADGHLYIKLAAMQNPDLCAQNDWYSLPAANQSSSRILSLLMAAKYANEPVKVYLNGCSANKPKIIHIVAE